MYLKLLVLIVLIIMVDVKCGKSSRIRTNNQSTNMEVNNCVYTEEEAQKNPWTAILKIQVGNANADYYACAILDKYTVLTYGRPFRLTTDKLAFLPWRNYSVSIRSERYESEITFSQSVEVSFIQPHPNYAGKINYQLWMFSENDYFTIHLKDPLKLSSTVRAVCLPQPYETVTTEELGNLYTENVTAIIGGWKKYKDLEKTSLTVKFRSTKECEKEWRIRTRTEPNKLAYKNRVCGYVSQPNENNPDEVCIVKDSGVLVQDADQYTFMGFVNTFYSYMGRCSEQAFFFIFKLTPRTLQWLNASKKCGSTQYTCHNGECVPLNTVCNQKKDGCSDGSDEDPKYCRALNPCTTNQFECGIYGNCISKFVMGKEAKNCDSIVDCPFSEDEQFCKNVSN